MQVLTFDEFIEKNHILFYTKEKNTATKDYIEFHDEACAVQLND